MAHKYGQLPGPTKLLPVPMLIRAYWDLLQRDLIEIAGNNYHLKIIFKYIQASAKIQL